MLPRVPASKAHPFREHYLEFMSDTTSSRLLQAPFQRDITSVSSICQHPLRRVVKLLTDIFKDVFDSEVSKGLREIIYVVISGKFVCI